MAGAIKRVDISRQGRARETKVPAQSTERLPVSQIVGNVAQMMFPALNSARVSVASDVADAAAKGQTARAAGAVARGIATYPAGFVDDVVGQPVRQVIGGIAPFVGGIMGTKGDKTVVATRPQPLTAAQAGAKAVEQGAVVAPTITPRDRMMAFVDTLLRGPVTLREAQAASGMLAQNQGKGVSAKDAVLGDTAATSQAIFQSQIDQAKKLAETDPDGARAVTEAATLEYYQRNAALIGMNPLALAQAQMFPTGEEED